MGGFDHVCGVFYGQTHSQLTKSMHAKILYCMMFTKSRECVAILVGLYKKNGAVSCVEFDFVFTDA